MGWSEVMQPIQRYFEGLRLLLESIEGLSLLSVLFLFRDLQDAEWSESCETFLLSISIFL